MALAKKQIKQITHIPNHGKETIFSIIGRMEVLIAAFESQKSLQPLVPFLETYYLVTRTVAEKSLEHAGYFHDPHHLQQLDVEFASLYFTPLDQRLTGGLQLGPWKTYFDYTRHDRYPFLQMLLGINTHINADLSLALVKTGYNDRKDFLKINKILEEVIPHIMLFLAMRNHDVYAFSGLVLKKFFLTEFHKTVVRWREDAWENRKKLKSVKDLKKLHRKTDQVSGELIKIFESHKKIQNAVGFLDKVNTLSVRL